MSKDNENGTYIRMDYDGLTQQYCKDALTGSDAESAKLLIEEFINTGIETPSNVHPAVVLFVATCMKEFYENDFKILAKYFKASSPANRPTETIGQKYTLFKDTIDVIDDTNNNVSGLEGAYAVLIKNQSYQSRFSTPASFAAKFRKTVDELSDEFKQLAINDWNDKDLDNGTAIKKAKFIVKVLDRLAFQYSQN